MTRDANLKRHRTLLLEYVRRHIVPAFVQCGFRAADRPAPADQLSREVFPLGLLRRSRPDGGADLAEVQFMTHRRAAFRINACAVAKDGLMTLVGLKSADELEAGGLHEHFEMYSSPRWRRWFAIPFWRLRSPDPKGYEALALRVAGLVPEVDSALREGTLGPHMRKITYPLG